MFIGRNDNLFFCFVKLVECMEKFFLSTFFSYYKLYIIDQQDINITIFVAKFLIFIMF